MILVKQCLLTNLVQQHFSREGVVLGLRKSLRYGVVGSIEIVIALSVTNQVKSSLPHICEFVGDGLKMLAG